MAPQRISRVIVMGAAGRDFHEFNVYWRERRDAEVVCFTATQIPDIDGRIYPPVLAGPRYPGGIPIAPEHDLEDLIRKHEVDEVAFAYSDVPHEHVMHQAARVNAAGARFTMLGANQVMLPSRKPVIAVCAVRTGCGKSQTTRRVAEIARDLGQRVAVVRHPMPYGDLERQVCQRYETLDDMDLHQCTIEEREEYERHIVAGNLLFAGIDYGAILAAAEAEADVILWDGGNNDLPFFRPDLHIVVADPHRAGHELRYFPGETNLRMADLLVLNKFSTAQPEDIALVEANVRHVRPHLPILRADSPVTADDAEAIRGRRVLVVEDGPTVTHGGMPYGAGRIAAQKFGAREIVDPRPHAVGSIHSTFEQYPHLHDVLPAMGYSRTQLDELEATINAVDCDVVLIGTPIDLDGLISIDEPAIRIGYELAPHDPDVLPDAIRRVLNLDAPVVT